MRQVCARESASVLFLARAVLAQVLLPDTPPADCDSQTSSAEARSSAGEAGDVVFNQDPVVGIPLARPR